MCVCVNSLINLNIEGCRRFLQTSLEKNYVFIQYYGINTLSSCLNDRFYYKLT